jgi:hypothetical protein
VTLFPGGLDRNPLFYVNAILAAARNWHRAARAPTILRCSKPAMSTGIPMPSLRARLLNRFLRLTTKSMWKPDLDIARIRAHSARMDARIARRARPVASEQVEIQGVKATWYGEPGLAERGTILYLHGGASRACISVTSVRLPPAESPPTTSGRLAYPCSISQR